MDPDSRIHDPYRELQHANLIAQKQNLQLKPALERNNRLHGHRSMGKKYHLSRPVLGRRYGELHLVLGTHDGRAVCVDDLDDYVVLTRHNSKGVLGVVCLYWILVVEQ